MWKKNFTNLNVELTLLFSCCVPDTSFDHVDFREKLVTNVAKYNCHTELHRQMALEVITNIPARTSISIQMAE